MDTGKSLRKTGVSPSGEIPSCPHNALLEILSRNHARVFTDSFLRDLPVSISSDSSDTLLGVPLFFAKRAVKRIRSTCLDYSRVEVAADARHRV